MKIIELILDEAQNMMGIEAISIVENPAIEEDFVALKSNELKLAEVDKEKKILMGALLIPNKPIYRKNEKDEYYIYFSKDTVRKASQLYLKNGNQNNSTLEHKHDLNGLTLVESWIVEDEKYDKSRKYDLDVPVGTWMGAVKVNNDEVWNEYVKTGKVKGFSIEGYFADKMQQPKDEDMSEEQADLLLSQITSIVKGERVELNMINDIKKAIDEYGIIGDSETGFNFVVKAETEYKDSLNKYERLIKNINKLSQKFESELKNIGISKKDAGVWTYMDSLDRTKEKTEKRISILKRNINDLKAINPN